ncbi:unnamed protein product [Cercopithifilaria johnstoni]|uniref:Uncharacterized protein n=1 Tax=Cercopithifilaria johnstoni TaxID=2874296 RepID=A0A8J2M4G4_9BILA|nr:unnamed protein product [Cercopithifilaria johnstoni]
MSGAGNRSKLRQLDKLIAKAKQNLNPVTMEVRHTTTQTNKREQSELEKKAREEILRDVALNVRRYEKIGPQGWCVLFENLCQPVAFVSCLCQATRLRG